MKGGTFPMQRSFIILLALAAVLVVVCYKSDPDEIATQDPCDDVRDTWSTWTPYGTSDPDTILAEQREKRYELVRNYPTCFGDDEVNEVADGYWQNEWTAFERSVADLRSWLDRKPVTQRLSKVAELFGDHMDPVQQAQLTRAQAFEYAWETGSLNGYRRAIAIARSMSGDTADIQALRQLTQVDLVKRAYKHLYAATMHNVGEERDFKADFPLATYVDPLAFAKEVDIVLPLSFYEEANLGPEVISELFTKDIMGERWPHRREYDARQWLTQGHDPDLIWRAVLQQHVAHNQWQEAMQVAVRELGAQDVKAVEDQRIAFLREQGKWMILENPDGSHVRVYPTWDEQPS